MDKKIILSINNDKEKVLSFEIKKQKILEDIEKIKDKEKKEILLKLIKIRE